MTKKVFRLPTEEEQEKFYIIEGPTVQAYFAVNVLSLKADIEYRADTRPKAPMAVAYAFQKDFEPAIEKLAKQFTDLAEKQPDRPPKNK